ncbi:MAG: DNA polymerase III subunit gamma/tau, partial [Pseudotabrizicola sp.]|nr:DNA polymerase III subunit gamma/tau [Pseudotabrizicola sp.]
LRAPSAPMRGPMMNSAGQAMALATEQVVYGSFEAVVELIRDRRDMKLLYEVEEGVRLVRYAPGRIEFEPSPKAGSDLAARLGQRLQAFTGQRWGVSVVSDGGAPTLAEARDAGRVQAETEVMQTPLVQAILAAFPGAKIAEIRSAEDLVQAAAIEALPEVEDEWDPFEDG